MNKPAALKATLVASCLVAGFVCLLIWPQETAAVYFSAMAVVMVVVLWFVTYDSFKRKCGDKRALVYLTNPW